MIMPGNEEARPLDDIDTSDLVEHALSGSERAWTTLVERFFPMIRAVARGYRLAENDVEDVSQTVWVLLLQHVNRIREPRALPAWLITTTRRESLRVIKEQRRAILVDPLAPENDTETGTGDDLDANLLRLEEARLLRKGLAALPPVQRELLRLLSYEPTLSYREISAALTMPIGSIGPTRSRGLARLRATPAVRDYLFPTRGEGRPA